MTKQELDAIRTGIKNNKNILAEISRVENIISRRGERTKYREEINHLTDIYNANKRENSAEKIIELAKNGNLTENEFLIFTLYYGNSMPAKDIARRYYFSERTVYLALSKARKKLNVEE